LWYSPLQFHCHIGSIQVSSKRKPEFHIGWTTITYRSVFTAVFAVLLAAGIFMYFVFPAPTSAVMAKAGSSVRDWLDKFVRHDATQALLPLQQAHFTNLDGTVRVRKASSIVWVKADYALPLEKGDVVQTMSEGIAKVAFPDGSTDSIQQDSLVTIEESASNAQQVPAVRLDTGEIHLNTGPQATRQQVKIDNSTTTVAPDSALLALNDRRHDKRQVMVTKGTAEFAMGNEKVTVAPYERVAFSPETGKIAKEKEIAPPVLLAPANMMPIFSAASNKPVEFSWTPVDNAKFYRLRISRNPYFSSVEKELKANIPEMKIIGLTEGRYYWVVQSVDAHGKESVESDRNGFTLIARGNETEALLLEIEPFVQHGPVMQVRGKTERGARVMVNGEEVPVILPDGSFSYFTPPLPKGESVITITAQNSRGGVSTQTKRVVIQ